jgi:DnaK suppressor protein
LTTPSSVDGPAASARLEAERVLVTDQLAAILHGFQEIVDASTDSNGDDEHDPEGSTIAFERSQQKALILQAEEHLAEIADALARVEQGRYGVCEKCGQPISAARLEARPVARTCIVCAGTAA